eukprot:CAMPEP_0178489074 /NCGR_PEP_ID=MMETSP0696-20121128/10188_1 /TAXON_ID=265572 /ORGANISM="Extubocellulus spinifer, Strain CCMP396" /LENGTH=57 /DNA_ID=CAMNT_0020116863 /DNA_START=323 /DNA_END=492 /DNA_ORIENTATION=+
MSRMAPRSMHHLTPVPASAQPAQAQSRPTVGGTAFDDSSDVRPGIGTAGSGSITADR